MCGQTRNECSCRFLLEPVSRYGRRRTKSATGETREEEGMARPMQHRPQKLGAKLLPIIDKWPHEPRVCRTVSSKSVARVFDRAFQYRCGPVVQRMGQRQFGMDPI